MVRSAQELQYHFEDRATRLRVSPPANRQLFDRFSFSFDVAFYTYRTRARYSTPKPLLIAAVHFPPASNRILDGCFLDGVRFRARRAIRIFIDSFLRHFIRLQHFVLSALAHYVYVAHHEPVVSVVSQKRKIRHLDPSRFKVILMYMRVVETF